MLFLFLTTIGASLVLQQKIRQEYEGVGNPRRQLALIEERFTLETVEFDRELAGLLEEHRALVARQEGRPLDVVRHSLFAHKQALEELDDELSRDPLDEAFADLERRHGEKKKKTSV